MADEDPRALFKTDVRDRIADAEGRVRTAFEDGYRFGRHTTWCIVGAGIGLIALAVTGALAATGSIHALWSAASLAVIVIAALVGKFLTSRQRALYTESNAWRAWAPLTREGLAEHAPGNDFDLAAAQAWRDERVRESDAILNHAWGEIHKGVTSVFDGIEKEARRMQKERVTRPP